MNNKSTPNVMKSLLPILILLLHLSGCQKDDIYNDFEIDYHFKITKATHVVGYFDSIIYYYDINKRLLQSEKYTHPDSIPSIIYYTYADNKIIKGDDTLHVDDTGKIIKSTSSYFQTDYFYKDGLLTHESTKRIADSAAMSDDYYFYQDQNIIKDSSFIYTTEGDAHNDYVIEYAYTDSLAPMFLIEHSGLFEYPKRSTNLISIRSVKNKIEPQYSYKAKYNYDISNNSLVMNIKGIDLDQNKPQRSESIKYRYEEKN